MDRYFMGDIGIDPDKYYWYTYRELDYIANAKTLEYKASERVEFAVYNTTFAGMSGQKVYKMSDMKKMFPNQFEQEEMVYDADKANELIAAEGLVKQ